MQMPTNAIECGLASSAGTSIKPMKLIANFSSSAVVHNGTGFA
jgi:hypothetical protein